MIQTALISVSDKTGVTDFGRALADLGVKIYSTGGTLRTLQDAGIPAIAVEDLTGFPEMMDGRVKTLHPKVHGGILALRNNESHVQAMQDHGITPIDLVVVNLYPFQETVAKPKVTWAEAIENIDIGGPTMVRAAAKNHQYVSIVVNPKHYDALIDILRQEGEVPYTMRRALAREAYAHTAAYDTAIAHYFDGVVDETPFPPTLLGTYHKVSDLRYGENPHQRAAFYAAQGTSTGLSVLKQWHGKELSYNNYVDMDAAWSMVHEFDGPAAIIVKHTNPCGAATADTLTEAYKKAYEADSVSAFGGIVAVNRPLDATTAEAMSHIFLEVVMAPAISDEAMTILSAKKNIRLITLPSPTAGQVAIKQVSGGLLVQDSDDGVDDTTVFEVVTDVKPTDSQWRDMIFAWRLVKHVKSNAIVVAKDGQSLGVGAGQMNRVGSANIALTQAGDKAHGAALASDAFFPFGDTVAEAAKAGIGAIIQPGGSIRDQESIDAANAAGIPMVFTHTRHFKH